MEILASNFSTMSLFRGSVWGTTSHELCPWWLPLRRGNIQVGLQELDAKGSGPASAPQCASPVYTKVSPSLAWRCSGALGSCLPPAPLRLGDCAGG